MKLILSKRFILVTFGLVVVLGIIYYQRQQVSKSAAKIETVQVILSTVVEDISSSGKTKAQEQVNLHFQAGGQLAWVGVKEGDIVEKNQTIASLDTQQLKKTLEKALRDYSKERNDFEEDKRDTYKDKALTDTAKRILEKNQWDLEKAVLDVELSNIALKWATLITPIPGIVTQIDTPISGANVTTTDTFTIANPQSIVFSASVDETDVGKITLGMPTTIELDAYPQIPILGKVAKITLAAETSTGGATVFPVEIELVNPPNLRIGLNGDVTIKITEITDALVIPQDALKEDNKGNYVVVKSKSGYTKSTVKTGVKGDDTIEILEGVSQDETIVIKGFEYLPKEIQAK